MSLILCFAPASGGGAYFWSFQQGVRRMEKNLKGIIPHVAKGAQAEL
jgi:hypothetical protein